MRTLIEILGLSTEYLEKHDIDRARLNSELLIAHVLQTSRLELYLNFDQPLDEGELKKIRELLRQRARRKPTQYILGKTEFFSLPIKVTPDVLIPRPETEILVEKALDCLRGIEAGNDVVVYEVGTGSGCAAIAIARNFPDARVYASDTSAKALEIARANAEMNKVEIEFISGDLLKAFDGLEAADVVVSNPPYVSRAQWESLPDEIRLFEPKEALCAGEDGLEHLRRLIVSAGRSLKPGGFLVVEIGDGQADGVQEIFSRTGCYSEVEVHPDLGGTQRVVTSRRRAGAEEL